MKIVLEFVKSVAFVFVTFVGFAVPWNIFRFAVNPYLVSEIIDDGYRQSPLHLLAVDTLQFIQNENVFQWWMIAALILFTWLAWKKPEKSRLRRIGIAVYIVPYIALTALLITASLAQKRAEPRPPENNARDVT